MWHSFCVYMIYFCDKYVQELQLAVYAFNFTLLVLPIQSWFHKKSNNSSWYIENVFGNREGGRTYKDILY